mmetsp:Transcript_16164/g.44755  ORF Transcript_16164/g.44755 Transcript_16164/m.44755 type:complete len:330 (+) Transcript_16164:169-1158(+)
MAHPGAEDLIHAGKTMLSVVYLSMLGVCFVIPVFYYIRMHCEDRQNRHLRDLEIAGMAQAMNESQDIHREETRAARRKYQEERRARIIQLFMPVRMIVTEENFIRSGQNDSQGTIQNVGDGEGRKSKSNDKRTRESTDIFDDAESGSNALASTMALGATEARDQSHQNDSTSLNPYNENDAPEFVLIPKPGLPDCASIYQFNTNSNPNLAANNSSSKAFQKHDASEMRTVQNECSICLCEYEVGSDVVWSSNPQCDHVFHANCIEQWLMKQRDGPLCPCCRRDFVIDPFDFGTGEADDLEKVAATVASGGGHSVTSSSTTRNLGVPLAV